MKKLEKYGEQNINLLTLFEESTKFLSEQNSSIETEREIDNPTFFPKLAPSIAKEHLALLSSYRDQVKERMDRYSKKIEEIDKAIEKHYASIQSTPYYLYSILIHEGSAETGHYYSYTYDINSKVWRKYNDINISEEVEPQVMKEARGINYTSAYYLVYAQDIVLQPKELVVPLRNYSLSA